MRTAGIKRRLTRRRDSAAHPLGAQKFSRLASVSAKTTIGLIVAICALTAYWLKPNTFWVTTSGAPSLSFPRIESGAGSDSNFDSSYSKAKVAVSNVAAGLLKQFPTDPRAVYLAGQLYSRFGLSTEAKKLWNTSLELNPSDLQVRMTLGTFHLESGDFEQAEAILHDAYKLAPAPSAAYMIATAQLNQGRLVQAEELLTSSLTESPDSFPNLVLLGQVLLQLKRPELARQRFLAAADLVPNNANVWFGIASACELLGQSEEAATYRKKFNDLQQLQLREDVEQARQHDAGVAFRQELAADCFLIGRFYLAKGDSAEAQKHWQLALQLNAGDINACFSLARLYLEQGQRLQSLNVLSSLSQHTSTDVDFWIQLGQAFASLEAFEHADEAYRRITELYPDLALGYAARCELRIRLGRPSGDTIELARQAVQRQPIAANQFLLSVASHQAGDNDTAIRAIHEAMRLEPQNLQYQQWNFSLQN